EGRAVESLEGERGGQSRAETEGHPPGGAAAPKILPGAVAQGAGETRNSLGPRELPRRQDPQLVRSDDGSYLAAFHGVDARDHVHRRVPRRLRTAGRPPAPRQPAGG